MSDTNRYQSSILQDLFAIMVLDYQAEGLSGCDAHYAATSDIYKMSLEEQHIALRAAQGES